MSTTLRPARRGVGCPFDARVPVNAEGGPYGQRLAQCHIQTTCFEENRSGSAIGTQSHGCYAEAGFQGCVGDREASIKGPLWRRNALSIEAPSGRVVCPVVRHACRVTRVKATTAGEPRSDRARVVKHDREPTGCRSADLRRDLRGTGYVGTAFSESDTRSRSMSTSMTITVIVSPTLTTSDG